MCTSFLSIFFYLFENRFRFERFVFFAIIFLLTNKLHKKRRKKLVVVINYAPQVGL